MKLEEKELKIAQKIGNLLVSLELEKAIEILSFVQRAVIEFTLLKGEEDEKKENAE